MENSVGSIVIETKVDTTGIKKGYNEIVKEIKQYEDKLDSGQQLSEQEQQNYESLSQQLNEILSQERERVEIQKENTDLVKEEISTAEDLLKLIESSVQEYNSLMNQKILDDKDLQYAEELKNDIKETVKEYEKMTGKKLSIKGITDTAKNVVDLKSGFKSLTKSAGKLVLGIIGVRTAYNFVRKMASSYLSTDEKASKKLEANWVALGQLMSGVISSLVAGLKKLVTGVLYFAQVLTGTNYIAKANEAILKKEKKAVDRLTASFDEMNTLGSANEGIGSNAELFELSDISVKARESIERIAKALKPVYDFIKEIIKFSIDHPDVILTILGGSALLSMIGKIIGVAGVGGAVGTGLAGLYSILGIIAGMGVITVSIVVLTTNIVKTINDLNELDETLDGQKDTIEKTQTAFDNYAKKTAENGMTEKEKENYEAITRTMLGQTKQLAQDIKTRRQQRKEMGIGEKLFNGVIGEYEKEKKYLVNNVSEMKKNIRAMEEQYRQGNLTKE